jgi:hypothetical protein
MLVDPQAEQYSILGNRRQFLALRPLQLLFRLDSSLVFLQLSPTLQYPI